jgi:hypothetical protein
MRKILPAALAFAIMLAPLSPLMAEGLGVGVGPGGIGVHVGDQDHGDRHNGCRTVITKYQHNGMTTTKRERKCD